eukprot:CAMPEP_0197541152 /NCGR_PEP_ID=MMETSP1318-20131121/67002_1 /TAXON_ID=552666 /ORGANISM="Partenskyella glossopodia, Strain RCC365" /LENGTH=237 /DNA_ID=CAMNT_0043100297 /DNA_START=164 /DNA_END=877 /DNA_ORIENTATION=+
MSYVQLASLKAHQRVHQNLKEFRCRFCPKGFNQVGNLRLHLLSTHASCEAVRCEGCKGEFSSKPNLIKHVHETSHIGQITYKFRGSGNNITIRYGLRHVNRSHLSGDGTMSEVVLSNGLSGKMDESHPYYYAGMQPKQHQKQRQNQHQKQHRMFAYEVPKVALASQLVADHPSSRLRMPDPSPQASPQGSPQGRLEGRPSQGRKAWRKDVVINVLRQGSREHVLRSSRSSTSRSREV